MTSDRLRDIAYQIPWRTGGVRAGAHKSRHTGGSGLFHDRAPFLASPDPRRIAVKASLTDPFENLLVNRYQQKSSISVQVVIDVSASMGCVASADKMSIACDIAEALSICATRAGDSFGLIVCDQGIRDDVYLPATRSASAAAEVIARLRAITPSRAGLGGLAAAAPLLEGSKKLVVLVSDFQWSEDDVAATYGAFCHHDCLAIEINDTGYIEELPDWGILSLRDSETGAKRLVWMRPSLKATWQARESQRRSAIATRARQTGRDLFTVQNEIVWDRFASYLMHGSVA